MNAPTPLGACCGLRACGGAGAAALWRRFARAIGDALPKGLYARSLIIIIAPWCCCSR